MTALVYVYRRLRRLSTNAKIFAKLSSLYIIMKKLETKYEKNCHRFYMIGDVVVSLSLFICSIGSATTLMLRF